MAAIVVIVGNENPAFLPLAGDIGLTGFALSIE
jgi:hypothetical protein